MTTPLNDAVVQALAETIAERRYGIFFKDLSEGPRVNTLAEARGMVASLGGKRVALTIEPEPEPMYPIRLTESERTYLISCCDHDPRQLPSVREFRERLLALTPEER